MKNFLIALQTEMSNRMKTPLIGTFALCWIAYNHDHVAKLLFSDNPARIKLIEETPFILESDLLIPIGLSLLYLLAIPLAQLGIDKFKYWLVEERRVRTHHSQQLEKYRSQTQVAKQQAKASTEYWHELNRNQAENASRQIINLKEQISHAKAQIREHENSVRTSESNYASLEKTNEVLSNELSAAVSKGGDLQRTLDDKLKKVEILIDEINKPLALLEKQNKEGLSEGDIQSSLVKSTNMVSDAIENILQNPDVLGNKELFSYLESYNSDAVRFLHDIFVELMEKQNEQLEVEKKTVKEITGALGRFENFSLPF